MTYSLQQVNALSLDEFVKVFGPLYEHSPWVAEQAAAARPFASFAQLLGTMQAQVNRAHVDQQLTLIRAHPELQGKTALAQLTANSQHEQKSAGLDQCTPHELMQFNALNQAYRDKFDFPFVIAVRGLTRSDILTSLITRLGNDHAVEFNTCLIEIAKIAKLRLIALTR